MAWKLAVGTVVGSERWLLGKVVGPSATAGVLELSNDTVCADPELCGEAMDPPTRTVVWELSGDTPVVTELGLLSPGVGASGGTVL